MDSAGNPDMQDVREGAAWVDRVTGQISWNLPPTGSSGSPEFGLSPDTVTVSLAQKKDSSIMALVLLGLVALIALAD